PPIWTIHFWPIHRWRGCRRRGNWEQRIWMAATLARPALQGLQAALPYVQRVGRQRMLWAGAAAVSAVAAGEVALRLRHHGGRGTLQGSPLSPLLANIYLHPFDVALTTQGLPLVRFMDDLVVMCATRDEAEQSLRLVERQLAAVRLSLNTEKTQIVDYADGLDFWACPGAAAYGWLPGTWVTELSRSRDGVTFGSSPGTEAKALTILVRTTRRFWHEYIVCAGAGGHGTET
ncbi:MAG: hypothetical protein HC828_21320, partial [Blastochloris sp.]|nr:hypothetical protein [Blastochloris sp.]